MNHLQIKNLYGPVSTSTERSFITILLDKIEGDITFKEFHPGHRFTFDYKNQPNIYIFKTGTVALVRQPYDILLDFFEAPTIRGMIPIHEASKSLFVMRAITSIEVAIIDKENFYSLLHQYQLWDLFAKHLLLVASTAMEVMFKLNSTSVYEMVRLQLYELMEKPDYIREAITAEQYIRGKTRISRSAIMRVLSELKKGKFITMDNGILKGIHKIPINF